jgi:hypothetical protein
MKRAVSSLPGHECWPLFDLGIGLVQASQGVGFFFVILALSFSLSEELCSCFLFLLPAATTYIKFNNLMAAI